MKKFTLIIATLMLIFSTNPIVETVENSVENKPALVEALMTS